MSNSNKLEELSKSSELPDMIQAVEIVEANLIKLSVDYSQLAADAKSLTKREYYTKKLRKNNKHVAKYAILREQCASLDEKLKNKV